MTRCYKIYTLTKVAPCKGVRVEMCSRNNSHLKGWRERKERTMKNYIRKSRKSAVYVGTRAEIEKLASNITKRVEKLSKIKGYTSKMCGLELFKVNRKGYKIRFISTQGVKKLLNEGMTEVLEMPEWVEKGRLLELEELVEFLTKKFPCRSRVELEEMDDEQAPPPGTKGTVLGVDDAGTIHTHWDNGSNLGLLYGVDRFKAVRKGGKHNG